jgi:hypothetical protein
MQANGRSGSETVFTGTPPEVAEDLANIFRESIETW